MSKTGRHRNRPQPVLARLGAHGTGDSAGPVVEAWRLDGPLAELVALHGAESPEELQRVLVIPGRRTDTMPDEACMAFARAHAGDPAGIVESVLLAVTNYRWRKVARQLLRRLEEDDVLDDGHINVLSTTFLEADDVALTVPGSWLAKFYVQHRDSDLEYLDPAKTYTLDRYLSPQVRRWAAAHHASTRDRVARVLHHTRRMNSRDRDATVLGLVDGTEGTGDADALEVLELAAEWSAADVRLAALQQLADRGRQSEALDRARTDRAAHIRRWAARNRQAPMANAPDAASDTGDARTGDTRTDDAPPDSTPAQQSLFP